MLVAFLSSVTGHLTSDVPYPEGRTGIYWLPMLTLSGLTIARLWERATPFLAAAMAGFIALFITEFRVTYYSDWPYDADTQTIARSLKRNAPDRKTLVQGSWQLEPSLNFYRLSDHLDWMAEIERGVPKAGADYYVLLSQDAHFLDELHLKTLIKGAHSGTILAQP